MNFFKSCFCIQPCGTSGRRGRLLWNTNAGRHVSGEFSMAAVQANYPIEDKNQIESGSLSLEDCGPLGTFVGIYDGHGGHETAQYITNHLFLHLKSKVLNLDSCSPGFTSEEHTNTMSADILRRAYQATEEGYLSLVTGQWAVKPQLAAVGSCCLVGVISEGTLYVANLGDSRAVLGRLVRTTGEVLAVQLTEEHNAAIESVRQELHSLHPDDPEVVVLVRNIWRVKGIIQISRSIGDVYLKKTEFNREPLPPKFLLNEPFSTPFLSSEPAILVQELQLEDQFLIFASDGLWENLDNQEAVDIVRRNPNTRSARKLVKAALQKAATKREMRYSDLESVDNHARRHFHDDITVIVVFLDSNLIRAAISKKGPSLPDVTTLPPSSSSSSAASSSCSSSSYMIN
ncbi:hypothetical protein ZIOFF_064064 [Zingiber officinale]|uniref:protein-serine/threonine phosphatase n=1 Tax=Zingiber officinale TaxID=94328 RepID=A0A8J5CHE0_ZINOF|nr:hypothetical protein ZIOFF_064064 [Zingiber officinale]